MKTPNTTTILILTAMLSPNIGSSAEFSRFGFDSVDSTIPYSSHQPEEQLSKDEVASAQRALNRNGYNIYVDGVAGQQTTSALRSFQAERGLDRTGTYNTATLDELYNWDSSFRRAPASVDETPVAPTRKPAPVQKPLRESIKHHGDRL